MATIKGTNNAETKYGTTAIDTIYGYGGNDSLYGRAGNDTVYGGLGNDKIWGETGNDVLRGEDGDDFVYGGEGNDVVYGGIGNDTLYGDAGTDTVKGDAGNDTIKGGTGISYLYGGDGNDQLYYDPTTSNIASLKDYLSGSILDGDSGYDTLNIFNKATYTSGSTTKAAATEVIMSSQERSGIYFENPNNTSTINVGGFWDIEKITVTGAGRLEFYNVGSKGIDITGTAVNDTFTSYTSSDTMRGGAGNDDFYSYGGRDTIISNTDDADRFYFSGNETGSATITGFNGAGVYGGDRIYFNPEWYGTKLDVNVSEYAGKTTFHVTSPDSYTNSDYVITVDKVGLDEGVDYFFL